MNDSFVLNSTRLARFWMVFVTSFSVLSAMELGNSGGRRELSVQEGGEGCGLPDTMSKSCGLSKAGQMNLRKRKPLGVVREKVIDCGCCVRVGYIT